MNHVEKISLDAIDAAERCSAVAHGELIQFTYAQETVVGFRTYYDDAMGGKEAAMIIGGSDHGHVAPLDLFGNPPALIITKLVRFVAIDPAPFIVGRTSTPGELYQHPESGAFLASGLVFQGNVRLPAFVYLTPEGQNFNAGHCLPSINPNRWRGISQRFAIEPIKLEET